MRVAQWWNGLDIFQGRKGRAAKGLIDNTLLAILMFITKFGINTGVSISVDNPLLIQAFNATADLCLIGSAIAIVGSGAIEVAVIVVRDSVRGMFGQGSE